jgi:hypothetical protein
MLGVSKVCTIGPTFTFVINQTNKVFLCNKVYNNICDELCDHFHYYPPCPSSFFHQKLFSRSIQVVNPTQPSHHTINRTFFVILMQGLQWTSSLHQSIHHVCECSHSNFFWNEHPSQQVCPITTILTTRLLNNTKLLSHHLSCPHSIPSQILRSCTSWVCSTLWRFSLGFSTTPRILHLDYASSPRE